MSDEIGIAQRMNLHRPYFGGFVRQWISDSLGEVYFANALDIACGTGHSIRAISHVASKVKGVDACCASVNICRQQGFDVICAPYQLFPEEEKFELLSCANAYQWFDQEQARAKFLALSKSGAIWLIYNFYFLGSASDIDFNLWYDYLFRGKYKSPVGKKTPRKVASFDGDECFIPIAKCDGRISRKLSKGALVDYLCTFAAIEARIYCGESLEDVREEIFMSLSMISGEQDYVFGYSYDCLKLR